MPPTAATAGTVSAAGLASYQRGLAVDDASNWRVEHDYVDATTVVLFVGLALAALFIGFCLSGVAFILVYRRCCPQQARAQLGRRLFGSCSSCGGGRRRPGGGQQADNRDRSAEEPLKEAVEMRLVGNGADSNAAEVPLANRAAQCGTSDKTAQKLMRQQTV